VERKNYTKGKHKLILNPFREVQQKKIDIFELAQYDVHEHFTNVGNSISL